jgi:DNA-binding response OmpR family regulator
MGRILLIDDEPELVRFVRRALEVDGHTVRIALDGAEGLREAVVGDQDLVILDLLMPGVDGRAVLSGLLAVRPGARVLVLSAVGDVGVRVDVLEQGAVDFLAKPFSVRELLARVRYRLRDGARAEQHGSETMVVGAITLDVRQRTLRIGERVTSLSQREFLLLQHLMRNADNVCSRAELLSEVWGYAFDPATNVVDVYVARLRHKIRSDVIQTVRNVGYQLQSS